METGRVRIAFVAGNVILTPDCIKASSPLDLDAAGLNERLMAPIGFNDLHTQRSGGRGGWRVVLWHQTASVCLRLLRTVSHQLPKRLLKLHLTPITPASVPLPPD